MCWRWFAPAASDVWHGSRMQAIKLLAMVCATAVGCGSGATAATDPAPPSATPAPSAPPPPTYTAAPAPATPAPTPSTTPDPAPSAPAPASPAPACKPEGKVLFEIDHRTIPGAHLATSTTKVHGNGAWTREDLDADGKAQPLHTGCFAKPDIKQLADALHAASWKVTTAQVRCMAMSSEFTVFLVDGKEVYTRKLCSGKTLDETSQAKLDQANAMVEAELKK